MDWTDWTDGRESNAGRDAGFDDGGAAALGSAGGVDFFGGAGGGSDAGFCFAPSTPERERLGGALDGRFSLAGGVSRGGVASPRRPNGSDESTNVSPKSSEATEDVDVRRVVASSQTSFLRFVTSSQGLSSL